VNAHRFLSALEDVQLARPYGFVRRLAAGRIEASGPAAVLGELCEIERPSRAAAARDCVLAEVTAVDERGIILTPLEDDAGIVQGARVSARTSRDRVAVGDGFAGRAVDALGRAIDGGKPIRSGASVAISGAVPRPMDRRDPSRVLHTGIRAIDGLLTLSEGQRVGIFAASGVGKTSLVEQLAVQTRSARTVLCLVGERGREVESLWSLLSEREDAERFTLVASTSDESPALRARAVNQALCLAEHWRDRGEHVLLMVDSVTRLAMALRDMGLAAGAPPTVRAYTPNVFTALPRLVERCGALRSGGAITVIMTVLSETDDLDDPIAEVMKSLLDGHILLSRTLAEQGHFPAIDVPRSVSRGADRLVAGEQGSAMADVSAMLAAYDEARVMIESGVYRSGTNQAVDRAIATRPAINTFLRQARQERSPYEETLRRLFSLSGPGAAHA
jgi:flagellum-specific ATP synthase